LVPFYRLSGIFGAVKREARPGKRPISVSSDESAPFSEQADNRRQQVSNSLQSQQKWICVLAQAIDLK
jgi:hypothetical protein